MKIQVINNQKALPIPDEWLRKARENLLQIVRSEGREPFKELNVVIVDDTYMASLNREFLKRNGTTDVIAFPLDDVGEIYVSAEVAADRSPVDPLEELALYVIHGLLHLLGYDHQRPEEEKIMREKERVYLSQWKR
ncbi:MAG: rRNA maturation RNase YbeY [Candidatus Hydrothermota bacterium]|uniref:Endoribonuclease YbeY n=1 Tax=candidate division WOR-3 bacterium TaxID=2052148 RepID=A0A7C1BFQ8_UNCW3|nr:MAG: rRNA maturation RNase YbeY [Candidatus Hydrothermae bacterium]RKZ04554.1 MAG: rRNA maturation RNase YbeY [Candidatus Hydrothermae bacterium]HDM90320.1 rRNA maturation RNase YbeY [candidate division WOR-3 bacterium]